MRVIPVLLALLLLSPQEATPPGGALVFAQIEGAVDQLAPREVITRAYQRLGVEVRFEMSTGGDSLVAPECDRFDGETSRIDGADQTYDHLVQVPIPVGYIQGMAYSKKYSFPVRGWHSLRPYKIGVVRGILFSAQGTDGMDVVEADSFAELIDWIADGVVEVGVMSRVIAEHTIRESGREGIQQLPGLLETIFLYHYVHERRRELGAWKRRFR